MSEQTQTIDSELFEQIKATVTKAERKACGRRIGMGKQAAKQRRAAERAQAEKVQG